MYSRHSTRPADFSRMLGRVPCPPGACSLIGKMNAVDWIVVNPPPKKKSVESLIPSVMAAEDGSLGSNQIDWGHGCGGPGIGFVPLWVVKRLELSSLCHRRTQWEVGLCRARRGPSPAPAHAGTLISASQNCESGLFESLVVIAARAKMTNESRKPWKEEWRTRVCHMDPPCQSGANAVDLRSALHWNKIKLTKQSKRTSKLPNEAIMWRKN